MANRINTRTGIKSPFRRITLALLLSLCILPAAVVASPLQEDDTRRLWNKQFEQARAKAKSKPRKSTSTSSTRPSPNAAKPPPAKAADEELIGVTIWRLRPATPAVNDNNGGSRILVRKGNGAASSYRMERTEAEASFREGESVRLSIETTRQDDCYLYVIDREVFADGRVGAPQLIFPAGTTPAGGNVVSAGTVVFVPALGDPIPYLTLERSRKDHVAELLTIIVSAEPLQVDVRQPKLDEAMVKRWEQQWGGQTERREASGGAGKGWTKAEHDADSTGRKLVQGDPLPQTIYRTKVKMRGRAVVTAKLRIEQ